MSVWRTSSSALILAVLVAGTSISGAIQAQPSVADGQPQDLYVASGFSGCSDTGPGSYVTPFCTIGAAAAVVVPGQTVRVRPGNYKTTVHLTRSGTTDAPITFAADHVDGNGVLVDAETDPAAGDAFDLTGVQHVVVRGFSAIPGTNGSAFRVDGSQDVTIDQAYASSVARPAVLVTGASSGVTVSRTLAEGNGTLIRYDSGSSGTIASDSLLAWKATAVELDDAAGTAVVGNTVMAHCQSAISVAGGAATIENNIVIGTNSALLNGKPVVPGACPTTGQVPAAVSVDADSVSGSHLDYDIVDAPGSAPYSWGGASYPSSAELTAATGQGMHESTDDPEMVGRTSGEFVWATPADGSPALDSADAGAPGETTSDLFGEPRADDPDAANDGTGSTSWFDRGAVENYGGYHEVPDQSVKPSPADGPLAVQVAFPRITPVWTVNGPIHRETTVHFGDGSLSVVSDGTQATHVYRSAGAYSVDLRWSGSGMGLGTIVVGATYTPVVPRRLLDTRAAIGVGTTTPVPAGGDVVLHLPAVDGTDPSAISAIAANVTVTQPTAGGVLTVYPVGEQPLASNLNFAKGQTVANMVTVKPDAGAVDIHNSSSGTVHVLLDLAGYYANTGSYFKPGAPVRVLDTRGTLGGAGSKPLAVGKAFTLDLSQRIPASATAVAMNVTVTQPAGGGHLSVYPAGSPVPDTSNINYTQGLTEANQVIVPVSGGKITFLASGSAVHAIADLAGWFGPTSAGATDVYVPTDPTRVLDTRNNTGVYNRTQAPLAPHESLGFPANWADGCSPTCPLATAFVLNVTATQPTTNGYLTVYADSRPTASTLNFSAGRTVPNQATVPNSPVVYNGSTGHVQVVADEEGYYMTQAAEYS